MCEVLGLRVCVCVCVCVCLLVFVCCVLRIVTSRASIDNEDCSAADLWTSLNVVLGGLPDDTIVFPAHDYSELKVRHVDLVCLRTRTIH